MNERFDPSDKRPVNPQIRPAEQTGQRVDPLTAAPVDDPLATSRRPEDIQPRSSRSMWPVLIIVLAGLVLALLVWMPSDGVDEQTNDAATQPGTTEQTTTPPVDNATPPADTATPPADTATPPADNSATPDATAPAAPATPDAAPATPDAQTPATGTDTQPPADSTAPQN
jgi:hypothetical protein